MTDNIDQSVWINTRKEPLVNHSRMSKGDIDVHIVDGVMGEAKVKDSTIAGLLLRRGHIGQEHYHAGLDLLELRKTRYGHLDAKSNFPCFLIGADTRIGKATADEVYSSVMRNLKQGLNGSERIVVFSMTSTADIPDVVISGYVAAFEDLLKVLEKTVADLKNAIAQ
jgi:hypothetical protein